jgi:hypothetical protein
MKEDMPGSKPFLHHQILDDDGGVCFFLPSLPAP